MRTPIHRTVGLPVAVAQIESSDPVRPLGPHGTGPARGRHRPQDADFAATLAAEERRSIQWSAHASHRLERRAIDLDAAQLDRLERAVELASARGGRSSVVWLDRIAYIVDVPSGTVITAVRPDQGREAVFTNIDSVVIA